MESLVVQFPSTKKERADSETGVMKSQKVLAFSLFVSCEFILSLLCLHSQMRKSPLVERSNSEANKGLKIIFI